VTLFPLDQVRNARPEPRLEPQLEVIRTLLLDHCGRAELGTTEDVLEAFDAARPRLNVLLGLLQDIPGSRGADISTGIGFLAVLLKHCGYPVEATENDLETSSFAEKRGVSVRRYDIGRMSPPFAPASLDFVVFAEVLEHLKRPPVATIAELASVLRPGGRLLLTTPNVARRVQGEALAAGENVPEPFSEDGPGEPTDRIGHVREYSIREVVEAVEAAGLGVDRVLMTGWAAGGYQPLPNPYANEIIVLQATR